MPRKENIINEFSSKTGYKQNFFYGAFTNNQINNDYFNKNLEKYKPQRIIYEVMIFLYYLYVLLSAISLEIKVIIIFIGCMIFINLLLFPLIYYKSRMVKFFQEVKSIANILSFFTIIILISVFDKDNPFKSIVRNFFVQNLLIILDIMFFNKYYSYFKVLCISSIYFVILYLSNYNLFTISIVGGKSGFIAKLEHSCSKILMSGDYENQNKETINYQNQILAANMFVFYEFKQIFYEKIAKANGGVLPENFDSTINIDSDVIFTEYNTHLT